MIYVGAGTSGRLAVQDAAECTVTYGVARGTVEAVIAGGRDAVFFPSENAEDKFELGAADMQPFQLTENDSVVGISASGNANYVCGALNAARLSGVDPELALTKACEKYLRRFASVEKQSLDLGRKINENSRDELLSYWKKAKKSVT
jgi:N-acetylmuramic acid 6-phosphate (MurNAc-6-P) etherase